MVVGSIENGIWPSDSLATTSRVSALSHDENIDFDRAVELVGGDLAERARDASLAMYRRAAERAEAAGFLLADTKFELGLIDDGEGGEHLVVADEVLTPDSSRFWAVEDWEPGATPQGFDKQPVRDFLESLGWDKRPPAPPLPVDVVAATATRYRQAYERNVGLPFDHARTIERRIGIGNVVQGHHALAIVSTGA